MIVLPPGSLVRGLQQDPRQVGTHFLADSDMVTHDLLATPWFWTCVVAATRVQYVAYLCTWRAFFNPTAVAWKRGGSPGDGFPKKRRLSEVPIVESGADDVWASSAHLNACFSFLIARCPVDHVFVHPRLLFLCQCRLAWLNTPGGDGRTYNESKRSMCNAQ